MLFLIFLLFFLICGGLAALTVLNFTTLVHINIMTWQSPDLPIGFWMIIAFVIGAVIFYLFAVASAAGDRKAIKRLQKQVSELEKQNEAAKAAATPAASIPVNTTAPGRPTGPLMPMPGSPQQQQYGDLPPQKLR